MLPFSHTPLVGEPSVGEPPARESSAPPPDVEPDEGRYTAAWEHRALVAGVALFPLVAGLLRPVYRTSVGTFALHLIEGETPAQMAECFDCHVDRAGRVVWSEHEWRQRCRIGIAWPRAKRKATPAPSPVAIAPLAPIVLPSIAADPIAPAEVLDA